MSSDKIIELLQLIEQYREPPENVESFIYLWTHPSTDTYPDGIAYIGCHTGSPNDGYIGSGIKFKETLKVYPINEWRRTIITYCSNSQKKEIESKLIKILNAVNDPKFLNSVGGIMENEDRIKQRQKSRERIRHTGPSLVVKNEKEQSRKQAKRSKECEKIKKQLKERGVVLEEKSTYNLRELRMIMYEDDRKRNSLISLLGLSDMENDKQIIEHHLQNMEETAKYPFDSVNNFETLGIMKNCNENLSKIRQEKLKVYHQKNEQKNKEKSKIIFNKTLLIDCDNHE